ncbi:MAG TPA: 6-carboxyhexanoate--CoA ligase [Geopsychrobacteraceae bacterium]|jgi:6-carboxyhexanoate--CoA ligase
MSEKLLSIRMHASLDGRHLSGAERLVTQPAAVEEQLLGMLQRALCHPRGRADRISLRVDEIPGAERVAGRLLDLSEAPVASWQQGRRQARQLLTEAGVSRQAADRSLAALANGAAPDGSSMRGAMLVDARSGARLEPDRARGIRVSRMDLTPAARTRLRQLLAAHGLDNPHVIEALILASKVISAPGMVAELCWSDDPDYQAGYVASAAAGYRRITLLKPAGEERGGRAFFVRPGVDKLADLIRYLERTPFLIDRIGTISRELQR